MGKTKARRSLRSRRTRRKPLRGGKLLGMGGSGYVHYGKEGSEAIQCSDGSKWEDGEIAKLGRSLTREFERAETIRKHYPKISEFAILPTRVCDASEDAYTAYVESQPDSDTKMMLTTFTEGKPEILFAPYGGDSVLALLTSRDYGDRDTCVKAIQTLRDQVREMNNHRVYHFDIGVPNVVYKKEEGKAYLIDFGMASILPDDEELEGEPDMEMMDDMVATVSRLKPKQGARRKSFQAKRK